MPKLPGFSSWIFIPFIVILVIAIFIIFLTVSKRAGAGKKQEFISIMGIH